MFRSILLLFLLVFIFGKTEIPAQATKHQDEIKVEAYLRHSNTFLWYARHRSNALEEFSTAKTYLDSATNLLKNNENVSSENHKLLVKKKNALDTTITNALAITIDNLNGRYPLYMDVIGQDSDLEFFDEAEEIALEKTLHELIQFSYKIPSKPINEIMHFSVITGLSKNSGLEEIAQQFLTKNTNSYIINDYDLNSILSTNQIIRLKNNAGNKTIYKLIADRFACDRIGIYSITKRDEVNNLFYYSAEYKTYNIAKQTVDYTAMAESFSMDRIDASLNFYILFLAILISNLIILLLIKLVGGKFAKWQDKSSSNAGFWSHFLINIACVVSSFVIVLGWSHLLAYIAPFEGAFHKEPFVVFWRISSFIFTPVLILFITFYAFSKLLKSVKVYRDVNSLLAIITGSLSGLLIYACYLYVYRFNELPDLVYIASFIIPSHLASISLSIALISLFRVSSKLPEFKKSLVMLIISLAAISYIYYYLWINRDYCDLFKIWEYALVSTSLILLAFVVPKIIFNEWIKGLFGKNKPGTKAHDQIKNNDDLFALFNNPLDQNIAINLSPDSSNKIIDIINRGADDNRIKAIYLKDKRDVGKTTFIKEFIIKECNDKVNFFYGDCDEFQDGNTVPYEPFVEAFESVIGKKGTSNSSEKSMTNFITQLGEIEGFGILKSFAGDDTISEVKYEQQDLLEVLFKVIAKSTDFGPTVIIFEDIQWMDNRSFELLKALTKKLSKLEGKSKLTFIYTSSEKDEADNVTAPIEQDEVVKGFIKNPKEIMDPTHYSDLEKINISETRQRPNYFSELKKKANLECNQLDEGLIIRYMTEAGITTPSMVQYFLGSCVKQGLISLHGNDIVVKENADFSTIAYSNKIKNHYYNLLDSLDEDLLNILETAAYIGNDFEATIVGKVWKMDRLKILILLRKAEKIGLVIDKSDDDDVYQFKSKIVVKQLREYAISSSLNSNSDKTAIPQLIKEYHKKIIEAFENLSVEKQENIDYNIICSMAERAYAYRENLHEKALKYTALAFTLSLEKGNLMNAKIYFDYFQKVLNANIQWNDELLVILENGLRVMNESSEGAAVLHSAESILLDLIKIDYPINDTIGNIYCQYLSASNSARTHSLNENILSIFSKSKPLFSDITIQNITIQESISDFYQLTDGQTKEKEKIISTLSTLFAKYNNKTEYYELNKKILNLFCNIFLRDKDLSNSDKVGEYLHQNLITIAVQNNLVASEDLDILVKIIQKETFPKLSNSDRVSLKYISGYYLDFLIGSNKHEKAILILPTNIYLNESLLDIFGLGLAYARQAKILLKLNKTSEVNDAYKNAVIYFLRNLKNNAAAATFNISMNLIAWKDFLTKNNFDLNDYQRILSDVESNEEFDLDLIKTENNSFATNVKSNIQKLLEEG